MVLSIFWIKTVIVLSPLFSLVTEIIVGAFVYVFALGLIWLLFGRLIGAESYFTDKLFTTKKTQNKLLY